MFICSHLLEIVKSPSVMLDCAPPVADRMCTRRTRPAQFMSLSLLACATVLHVLGAVVNAQLATPPAPGPTAAAPGPAPPLTLHQKVVDALRAAGTFGAISGALDSLIDTADPIKPDITLFAPSDNAFTDVALNSTSVLTTLLNYQTASGTYDFQNLLGLSVGYRIPTVTPEISIVVKDPASVNYQLDNAFITNPDIYNNGSVVVHGVDAIFFTRLYNTATLGPVPAPAPVAPSAPVSTPASAAAGSTSTTPAAGSSKTSPNDAPARPAANSFAFVLLGVITISLALLISPNL